MKTDEIIPGHHNRQVNPIGSAAASDIDVVPYRLARNLKTCCHPLQKRAAGNFIAQQRELFHIGLRKAAHHHHIPTVPSRLSVFHHIHLPADTRREHKHHNDNSILHGNHPVHIFIGKPELRAAELAIQEICYGHPSGCGNNRHGHDNGDKSHADQTDCPRRHLPLDRTCA